MSSPSRSPFSPCLFRASSRAFLAFAVSSHLAPFGLAAHTTRFVPLSLPPPPPPSEATPPPDLHLAQNGSSFLSAIAYPSLSLPPPPSTLLFLSTMSQSRPGLFPSLRMGGKSNPLPLPPERASIAPLGLCSPFTHVCFLHAQRLSAKRSKMASLASTRRSPTLSVRSWEMDHSGWSSRPRWHPAARTLPSRGSCRTNGSRYG